MGSGWSSALATHPPVRLAALAQQRHPVSLQLGQRHDQRLQRAAHQLPRPGEPVDSGKRRTTVYRITDAGRQAVRDWVRSAGKPAPTLEQARTTGRSTRISRGLVGQTVIRRTTAP